MDFFRPGNILRIPNYEFENGGEPRDKYLIVIVVSEQQSLLLLSVKFHLLFCSAIPLHT